MGNEYLSEYLKVLPLALKVVHETGNENCRKVASRLVNIWEERKVFGSRIRYLKNEMPGENPSAGHSGVPSPDINPEMNSNPIKVVEGDNSAHGSLLRKILTTFQLVQEEEINEETTLNICRNAVSNINEIVDFVDASSQGNLKGSDIVDHIQKQENVLQQCINQLESSAEIRVALISQLKEALQDQVAQCHIKKAENIKLMLTSSPTPPTSNNLVGPSASRQEENKKAIAAALVAELTSISSSAQMLTSVLSSLVAEEAVSKSPGLKRPKLESPPPRFPSLNNTAVVSSTYVPQPIH
ncbi:regulation of nuclear pre-mRNA domain-containing protein 1B-like [Dorcoceras hygrometricum]|uniref:Regulation of nuclear pre-mRNA domain-containing protein 1B-like n=1 Tax=Dorcoceras hygrometricum TaxID=472368 RepID=A0A2Z7CNW3_9LAMI|nr:regulation of nuclear pre-mRNA domain-containing protein 1B-like [Dorcoceras hygrometricum]